MLDFATNCVWNALQAPLCMAGATWCQQMLVRWALSSPPELLLPTSQRRSLHPIHTFLQ